MLPLGAICLPLAILTQPAQAGDRKTFPGSSCTTWGNVDAEITGSDGGSVLNASFASAYTVSCPVARDNSTNTNGIASVSVHGYRDGSTATPLSCIFKVVTASTGADYHSLSRAHISVAGVGETWPIRAYKGIGLRQTFQLGSGSV